MQIALSHLNLHLNGILHSYSQIMFAKNKWIGFVLLLVSFLYPTVGVCGLLCGIGANALAHLLNQDTTLHNEGGWGFGAHGMQHGTRWRGRRVSVCACARLLCVCV